MQQPASFNSGTTYKVVLIPVDVNNDQVDGAVVSDVSMSIQNASGGFGTLTQVGSDWQLGPCSGNTSGTICWTCTVTWPGSSLNDVGSVTLTCPGVVIKSGKGSTLPVLGVIPRFDTV
jgi:hypothetical protein